MTRIAPCLWFDGRAEEAANFYAAAFPDSRVDAIHRSPADYPSGKAGDVLTVEFTVAGVPCLGLNGGPAFRHTEAFSFQIATDDQAETDRPWEAIVGMRACQLLLGHAKPGSAARYLGIEADDAPASSEQIDLRHQARRPPRHRARGCSGRSTG